MSSDVQPESFSMSTRIEARYVGFLLATLVLILSTVWLFRPFTVSKLSSRI